MTSVVAAIVALGAGSVVAAFLYFKRGVNFPWDLALLRLVWTGLLVYALSAPPVPTESEQSLKPILTIALDSSRSLGVSGDSLAQAAVKKFEDIGFDAIVRDFNESFVPSNRDWAYVGDGHISILPGASIPAYYLLAPSNPLKPAKLLQGIVVPQSVLKSSKISVEVLALREAKIDVLFNGKVYSGSSISLQAPAKSGTYKLFAVASQGDRKDSLTTLVEVKEHLASIALVSNAPHPHEALVRRWCEGRGIAVEHITWRELEQVSSINGPLVTIGGGEVAIEKAHASVKVPMLHLDGGAVAAFTELISIPYLLDYSAVKVYSKITDISIPQGDYLDTRGIHWYKSGLASEKTLQVFHALLEELMQRFKPAQLRLTLPQQAAIGEQVSVLCAVVNSRLEVLPADFTLQIKKGDTLVEEITLRPEGNSAKGIFTPTLPGNYRIVASANWSGGRIETTSGLQVEDVDIENVRPRNQSLINSWASAGAIDASKSIEKVAPTILTFEQKNPQHLHVWYWGLALLAASAEWILRRRRGLV